MAARLIARLAVSPTLFRRIAVAGLVALGLVVMTGAGVRLTGSGLGCPDWPRCYGNVVAPLQIHSLIEWGNRVFSAGVGFVTIAVALASFLRRPFRRDLAILGGLLPVTVLAQGILGGLTVVFELRPGFVMGHFGLSMVALIAGVALVWRAYHEPGDRPRATDRLTVWATRLLLPVGIWTIFDGTAVTASGPHAGASGTGEIVPRLTWHGSDTFTWMVRNHAIGATAFGVLAVIVWVLARYRGGSPPLRRASTWIAILLAIQGAVGIIQYENALPTELVWIHVGLATSSWIAMLFAVAGAGRLAPRRAGEPAAPGDERGAPPGDSPAPASAPATAPPADPRRPPVSADA